MISLAVGRVAELGRRVDRDRVGEMLAAEGANLVAFEVLDQGSAHRHVDHLLAAAEAEHRDLLAAAPA